MTYEKIRPYLRALSIIIKDINYQVVSEEEARRRIVDRIEAGKIRPDELYVYIH